LIEAGRIDGAGEWTLFRRVVIPLGIAAAASLAIFQFIWSGTTFSWRSSSSEATPRTAHLVPIRPGTDPGSQLLDHLDRSMVSIVVPLIVFLAFQRHFVRGMLAGAVK